MSATATKPRRVKVVGSRTIAGAMPANRPATAIENRAMLATLSISCWEGVRQDKDLGTAAAKRANAEQDAVIFSTRHVPVSALKPIKEARGVARDIHAEYTLPWGKDGSRILPADRFMEYTEAMRKARRDFEIEVDKFVGGYPALLAEAKSRMGHLYDPDYFPTVENIRDRYTFELHFTPIPTADDFRVTLTGDAVRMVRADIEKNTARLAEEAMGDLWERLHEAVAKIADKLGDGEAIFRDSMIGNVKELCGVLDRMNITQDARLTAMGKEITEKLTKLDPDTLRENKGARGDGAKAANNILKSMEGFFPNLKKKREGTKAKDAKKDAK